MNVHPSIMPRHGKTTANGHRGPHTEARPRKVLLVVHRRDAQPGNVRHWLVRHGYEPDIRCPRHGDPLPPTLRDHAGAVIFGGPMSANDPDEYIRREIRWLEVPLKEEKPFLGICLGAQMLAKHLGARVSSRADGLVEAGYFPIEPSAAGRALLDWPSHVYQWHGEGFALPHGAVRLASGMTFENQAMRYGAAAFGVQFHPETTEAIIRRWTTLAAHWLAGPGARPQGEHLFAHLTHGARLRGWLHRFMPLWLEGTASDSSAPVRDK